MNGDGNFRWWRSHDEEAWHFANTKEEAIEEGLKEWGHGPFLICQADQMALTDDIFDADQAMAMFEEKNGEALDPNGPRCGHPTAVAAQELRTALADAFAAWRKKHNLWQPYSFENIRHEEWINNDLVVGMDTDHQWHWFANIAEAIAFNMTGITDPTAQEAAVIRRILESDRRGEMPSESDGAEITALLKLRVTPPVDIHDPKKKPKLP